MLLTNYVNYSKSNTIAMNTNYTTGTWIHYQGTYIYKQTNTYNSTALNVTKSFIAVCTK